MKKLTFILTLLFVGQLSAQVVLTKEVDVSDYPSVSFSLHHPNPDISENAIQIHQILDNQSIHVEDLSVDIVKTNNVIATNKCVLILYELTFNKQRNEQINTFYSALKSAIPRIVNQGDEVKICTFSLRDNQSVLLNDVNKTFTGNHKELLNGLSEIPIVESDFSTKNTSDIYASLLEGLNKINEHHTSLPKAIVLLSEERNNRFSPEQSSENVVSLARASKVSINTIKYNRANFETYADPSISKGTYGLHYVLNSSNGNKDIHVSKKNEAINHLTTIFDKIPLRSLGSNLNVSALLLDSVLDGGDRILNVSSSDLVKTKIKFSAKGNLVYASFQQYFWITLSISIILLILIIYSVYKLIVSYKQNVIDKRNREIEFQELQSQQNEQIAGQEKAIRSLKEKDEMTAKEIDLLRKEKSHKNIQKKLLEEMRSHGQLPVLRYSDGLNLEDFVINKPTIWIGREESNDIVISSKNYSKKHFKVCYLNGGYYFEDNKSTNGIIFNGIKKQKSELSNGDTLEIALTKFTFIK